VTISDVLLYIAIREASATYLALCNCPWSGV